MFRGGAPSGAPLSPYSAVVITNGLQAARDLLLSADHRCRPKQQQVPRFARNDNSSSDCRSGQSRIRRLTIVFALGIISAHVTHRFASARLILLDRVGHHRPASRQGFLPVAVRMDACRHAYGPGRHTTRSFGWKAEMQQRPILCVPSSVPKGCLRTGCCTSWLPAPMMRPNGLRNLMAQY